MQSSTVINRWIAIFLLISFAGICWLFKGFLLPLLISALLVLMCGGIATGLEQALTRYRILRNSATIISAGLITLLVVGLLVIPLIALLSYVISKINYHDLLNWKTQVNQVIVWFSHITWINPGLKHKIISEVQSALNGAAGQDNLKKSATVILNSIQKLSSSTFELVMIIVFFFLLLWKRRPIADFLAALSPLPTQLQQQITMEVTSTLQVVFCSLLALAITQGLAFAGLMLFYDYNAPTLGFAAGVCSLIPVFGAALVWVPVAIIEFATGHIIGALVIAVFGWLVMAVIIDNFLRIILLKKIAKSLKLKQPINEFLLFFAIAGGLSMLGFWGILLGPALVTLFLALSHVYINSKTKS